MNIIPAAIDFTAINSLNPLPPVNPNGTALPETRLEFVPAFLDGVVTTVVNTINSVFAPAPSTPVVTPMPPSEALPTALAAEGFDFPPITPIDRSGFDPLTNVVEVEGFLPADFTFDIAALNGDKDINAAAVLNTDDRLPVHRPDCRIGMVSLPNCFGTGTIVGRFTIITNAHVVESAKSINDIKFIPGKTRDGNQREYIANRCLYWNDNPNTPWKDDFAIITFSEPIGDRFGWFGYTDRATVTPNFTETGRLTGYSGDIWNRYGLPSTDFDIVRGDVEGTSKDNDWTHRIDTNPGASGSAIVSERDNLVLGVHWGGSSSNNHWTPLNRNFLEWIQRADREAAEAYARRK
ncbi:MAG: trypsin-like serine peptidase [Pseudanabaenaceae cyanobacterium]